MKILALVIMTWSLMACMNMQEFNEQQRQKPQTYPNRNPNCTRQTPPPSQTSHLSEYQQYYDRLNQSHCR